MSGYGDVKHPRSAGTPVFYDSALEDDPAFQLTTDAESAAYEAMQAEEEYHSLLAQGYSDYEARAIVYEEPFG